MPVAVKRNLTRTTGARIHRKGRSLYALHKPLWRGYSEIRGPRDGNYPGSVRRRRLREAAAAAA